MEGDSLHHRKGVVEGAAPAVAGVGSIMPLPLTLMLFRDLGTRGGNDAATTAGAEEEEEEEESRLALRRGNTGSISGCRDSNDGLLPCM